MSRSPNWVYIQENTKDKWLEKTANKLAMSERKWQVYMLVSNQISIRKQVCVAERRGKATKVSGTRCEYLCM